MKISVHGILTEMRKLILLLCFILPAIPAVPAAERVVSLSPNLTEALCLIGGEALLAGRTDSCNRPASVLRGPSVGKFLSPSPERIAALEPTLVISTPQPGRNTAQLLTALSIRFVELPDRTLADYPALLRRLGRLLALPAGETEARRAEQRLAELRRIAETIPEERRVRVFFLAGTTPAVAAGRRSFLHQLLELAGARNLAEAVDRAYFTVSPEWVANRNPDLILIPGPAAPLPEWLRRFPVRVIADPDPVCRLGPRLFEGIDLLKTILRETGKGTVPCR